MRITGTKDMPALKAAAAARISRAAAAERAKHVTSGKANIYSAKEAEAERWLKGRPATGKGAGQADAAALADFPYLAAEVGVTADTVDELAALWRDKAHQYNKVTAPAIERREHAAKKRIAAARSPAELDSIKL